MCMPELSLPVPRGAIGSRIVRWLADIPSFRRPKGRAWRGEDKSLRALSELGDDQLVNLSETGQPLWRKVRRERAQRRLPR
jgi:hypothetical protein